MAKCVTNKVNTTLFFWSVARFFREIVMGDCALSWMGALCNFPTNKETNLATDPKNNTVIWETNQKFGLFTVLTKWDKVWQNPTRIPTVCCFKLANSVISSDKIDSESWHPSKIWQPWCPNFGNPENQIAYLQVFEHA